MTPQNHIDEILQWRGRIEEALEDVQSAAGAALEKIDSVLGVVRAVAAGEPPTKRQRCDALDDLGVFDTLHEAFAFAELGEAAESIAEAVECVMSESENQGDALDASSGAAPAGAAAASALDLGDAVAEGEA